MEGVEIVPVQDKQSWKQFVELPYRLYRNHPYWVPPLRMAQKELLNTSKHPFYAHAEMQCFLARRDGQVSGRVAAIVDRNFNAFQEEEAGFFGFYEAVEDVEVTRALMEAARKWLLERGTKVIRGPVNPSTNYECGLLVEGFDSSPNVTMPYNPPVLCENAGGRRAAQSQRSAGLLVHAQQGERRQSGSSGEARGRVPGRGHTQPMHVKVRGGSRDDLEAVQLGLDPQLGFRPDDARRISARSRRNEADFEAGAGAGGGGGRPPVGFALALPNINLALKHAGGRLFPFGLLKILYHQRLIKELRVLALGVVEEYRTVGVAAGFYAALIRNARRLGFGHSEMSWILEDNVLMNRSLEALGCRKYKTYRIYEWN